MHLTIYFTIIAYHTLDREIEFEWSQFIAWVVRNDSWSAAIAQNLQNTQANDSIQYVLLNDISCVDKKYSKHEKLLE